jgi:16S rRNA G966 N2-methylase RsmD
MKGRRESEQMQYASESDMFKTLVGAGARIQAAEAKAASGADTYMYQEKAKDIKANIEEQLELRDEFQGLDMTNETDIARSAEIKDELRTLKSVYTDPEFSKAMLKWVGNKKMQRWLEAIVIKAVEKELKMPVNMTDPKFFNKYTEIMTEILGDFAIGIPPKFEKGGRVSYQTAGSVQDPILQQEAAAVQDAGMPEELTGITFEELRARLPQEVSDEIVRLLANSAEALEDFATIQTEQDIANFNKKYGVNLVLPSEA